MASGQPVQFRVPLYPTVHIVLVILVCAPFASKGSKRRLPHVKSARLSASQYGSRFVTALVVLLKG